MGRQGHPGLNIHDFRTITATFFQIGRSRLAHVHQTIGTLEAGQAAFHAAQFFFNDQQAIFNELGRIDRHLVFLADGVLIVLDHQRIQDVRYALRIVIPHRQRQDTILMRNAQPVDEAAGGGIHIITPYVDGNSVIIGSITVCRLKNHLALAQTDRVSESRHDDASFSRIDANHLAFQRCDIGIEDPGIIHLARELHNKRCQRFI